MNQPTKVGDTVYPSFRAAWRAAGFPMSERAMRNAMRLIMSEQGFATYRGVRFERA